MQVILSLLVLPPVLLFVATVQASVLTPPVLPLFVRNPYLNVWLGDAREPPWGHWPMFWTGQNVRDHPTTCNNGD